MECICVFVLVIFYVIFASRFEHFARLCSIYSITHFVSLRNPRGITYVRNFRRVVSEKSDLLINPLCAKTNYRVIADSYRKTEYMVLERVDEKQ